jgi:hypothetical protein
VCAARRVTPAEADRTVTPTPSRGGTTASEWLGRRVWKGASPGNTRPKKAQRRVAAKKYADMLRIRRPDHQRYEAVEIHTNFTSEAGSRPRTRRSARKAELLKNAFAI